MSPVPYTKPHLPVADQLQLLQARGMVVTDTQIASQYLERIGYYRLSGYWYPFRQSRLIGVVNNKAQYEVLDDFRQGTEFRHAVDLYVFDKRLRLLLLDAIERIEVGIRVDIALLLGARDAFAHRSANELHGNFTTKINAQTGLTGHHEWLDQLDKHELRSKDDFAKHFRTKYSSDFPIWVSIELWDFGMMSKLFGGMKHADQSSISIKYGIQRPELLASWLRSLNHIRNVCAHHSRLWNISPADQPKPPRIGEIIELDDFAKDQFSHTKLYAAVAVAQFLLRRINPTSSWPTRLIQHFKTFPKIKGVVVGQSGFPTDWEKLPLWAGNQAAANQTANSQAPATQASDNQADVSGSLSAGSSSQPLA